MNWEDARQIIWLFVGLLCFEILGLFMLEVFKHPLVRDAERDYKEFMEYYNSIKGGKV